MSTEWASAFYSSTHWKKCREGFIAYKRGLCEECLKKGIIKAGTQVHHKIPLTPNNIRDPNVTLSWKNLEMVCDECHSHIHEELKRKASGKRKHRRYEVNKDGTINSLGGVGEKPSSVAEK